MKIKKIRNDLLKRVRVRKCDNCDRSMSIGDKECKLCNEPNEDYRKFTGTVNIGSKK